MYESEEDCGDEKEREEVGMERVRGSRGNGVKRERRRTGVKGRDGT